MTYISYNNNPLVKDLYLHDIMQDVHSSIFSKSQVLTYRSAYYNFTKEPLNYHNAVY